MKKNIGSLDRMIRLILGLAGLAGGFYFGSWLYAVIGAILLGTALINFCPIWAAIGVNTRKGV